MKGSTLRARSGRRKRNPGRDAPPQVYQQMLADAGTPTAAVHDADARPVKKRRVAGRLVTRDDGEGTQGGSQDLREPAAITEAGRTASSSPVPEPALQIIDYNPDEFASDEDEDMEDDDDGFENVDIGEADDPGKESAIDTNDASIGGKTLDLTLKDDYADRRPRRQRKAVVAITNKKLTVAAHQIHLLCSLSHFSIRNHWCNDSQVQKTLRKVLPKSVREQLVDDASQSQYTRDWQLREGLQKTAEIFAHRFEKTRQGMTRAWWDAPENEIKPPTFDSLDLIWSLQDFRKAALQLKGSRDVGAQLFCAMLRACGLEVRLVHSLQILPINGQVRPEPPRAPSPMRVVKYEETRSGANAYSDYTGDSYANYQSYSNIAKDDFSREAGQASGVRRKLARLGGRSSLASAPSQSLPTSSVSTRETSRATAAATVSRPRESLQPVYWVEVLSPAYQKWISLDPIVTRSFSKPSAMHPAQKDMQNSLAYVIAMEEDGGARDVTRRYTTAYNAKTRRLRIDGSAGSTGSKWLNKAMKIFRRPLGMSTECDDRDQIEDAEFQRRSLREGMPKNIEDFKGHPLYVLERHLRRNEVISPKRQVGTTGGERGASTKGKPTEPVFRRQDVRTLRTSDAWYRLGREIKLREQPMKRVPLRRRRDPREADDEDEEDEEDQGLYDFSQTQLYEAPAVILGQVPRNAYGNLDVYVPTMIPPGAVHVLHADARFAARLLGIDYADAVTGFEFKGRQGTAVTKGVVVAAEYRNAITEVLEGFEAEKLQAAIEEQKRLSLHLWRRFLVGLRVRERVNAYASDTEKNDESDEAYLETGSDLEPSEGKSGEGGFVAAEMTQGNMPSSRSATRSKRLFAPGPRGDFTIIEGPSIEPPEPSPPTVAASNLQEQTGDIEGGSGFLPEGSDGSLFGEDEGDEASVAGGGFVVEEDVDDNNSKRSDGTGSQPAVGSLVENTTPSRGEDWSAQTPVDSFAISSKATTVERLDQDAKVTIDPSSYALQADTTELGPDQDEDNGEPLPSNVNVNAVHDSKEIGEEPELESKPVEKKLAEEEDEDNDRGSLLSEDPEDADADPDWLA